MRFLGAVKEKRLMLQGNDVGVTEGDDWLSGFGVPALRLQPSRQPPSSETARRVRRGE
jgi:hypothetical protein